ncbi:MAG: methyltransferase domain-containing protein [Phycisphaerales bacterium]|nr:methyltransferase domain-containing protein [Phycisphaerales bacterium]
MTEWHASEELWDGVGEIIFTPERMKAADGEVEQVLKLADVPPKSRVLDAACGPGRHSLAFARRGHSVTGVDQTGSYLEKARASAAEEGLHIEWVHGDLCTFRREAAFDLTVNLLTSFGYYDDPADDRRAAENFLAGLLPGGRLVIDVMGKEVLARIFRPRDWHETPDGAMVLEERTIADDWRRIAVRWITIRGGERREHRFGHRIYSAAELCGLLTDVGFVDLRVYGSLAGAPYNHEAERLVVVGTKQ